jgi:hypothetical protein
LHLCATGGAPLSVALAESAHPMLKWSETDLTEFFGVVATFHDDAHSRSFDVSRDGLRLLVTLFDLEGAVYVSIFRDGLAKPLFTARKGERGQTITLHFWISAAGIFHFSFGRFGAPYSCNECRG